MSAEGDEEMNWSTQEIETGKAAGKLSNIAKLSALVLAAMSLVGCGALGAATPGCSDNEVKNLVLQLKKEHIRLDEAVYKKNKEKLDGLMKEMPGLAEEIGSIKDDWKLEDFLGSHANSRELFSVAYDVVSYESTKLTIGNIRTAQVDESTHKVFCEAQINKNVDLPSWWRRTPPVEGVFTSSMTYTAQHTDDGQLYVEIYGQ